MNERLRHYRAAAETCCGFTGGPATCDTDEADLLTDVELAAARGFVERLADGLDPVLVRGYVEVMTDDGECFVAADQVPDDELPAVLDTLAAQAAALQRELVEVAGTWAYLTKRRGSGASQPAAPDGTWRRLPASAAAGPSLRGHLRAPRQALVDTFGPPDPGDGDKTTAEWCLEFGTSDGPVVATVYDVDEDPAPVDPAVLHDWHIGGHRDLVACLVAGALPLPATVD